MDPKLLKMGIFKFKPLNPGLPLRKLWIFISRLGEVDSVSGFGLGISEDWHTALLATEGAAELGADWGLEKPRELDGSLKGVTKAPGLGPAEALLAEVEETSEVDELGE